MGKHDNIKRQLHKSATEFLYNPVLNKGTAFSDKERDEFSLRGLLPPRVHTQKEQIMRVLENFRKKTTPLSKYIYLIGLQDRNETLFYRMIIDHIEEMMPIIYTPTVGEACLEYANIFRRPQGLFITAKDSDPEKDLLKAIKKIKPTALIGVCGQPQVFTEDIIKEMSAINERPIIFAFSNPSSKAECTAEQAYRWNQGNAIFASSSPFDPIEIDGKTHVPGQGNNSYIFPSVGLGVITSGSSVVLDEMFLAAAKILAQSVKSAGLQPLPFT